MFSRAKSRILAITKKILIKHREWLWFILLWMSGVLCVSVVTYVLKLTLKMLYKAAA